MVNEDILAGLKSAISHGYSMEEAMLSLVNSGYNAQEVREAASYISQPPINPSLKPAQPASLQPLSQMPEKTQKNSQTSFVTILLIIGISILTIAIVGIILFWKEISSFLS